MTAVSEATLTLDLTLEEAHVLAQALDLLASDPGLISAEWPNIEVSRTDDDNPKLAALGYAAFNLSSRVHDLINGAGTSSWVEGLRTVMKR